MTKSTLLAVAFSALVAPVGAQAATIGNDVISVFLEANGEQVTFGGFGALDGLPPGDVVGFPVNLDAFEVKWVDDDTFFFRATAQVITNLTIKLIGLDLVEGLLPAPIRNVVFDPTQGGFTDFVGHTSIAAPTITFDANSITISLPEIPSSAPAEQFFINEGVAFDGDFVNLAADGIPFFFNVTAFPDGDVAAPVPLPAAGWLLAGAIGLLGVSRRRRSA